MALFYLQKDVDSSGALVCVFYVCGAEKDKSSYLVQGESADTESGQFYGVQQGHLGHTIGFCAATGPVLVTLNLEVGQRDRQRYHLQCLYHSLLNGVSTNVKDHVDKRKSKEKC